MTIFTDLRKTKKLLKNPRKWTTGNYALTKDNCSVGATDKKAAKWCLVGATCKVKCSEETKEFLKNWTKNKFGLYPIGYNDNHSHEEVLALLDLAMKEAPRARK